MSQSSWVTCIHANPAIMTSCMRLRHKTLCICNIYLAVINFNNGCVLLVLHFVTCGLLKQKSLGLEETSPSLLFKANFVLKVEHQKAHINLVNNDTPFLGYNRCMMSSKL